MLKYTKNKNLIFFMTVFAVAIGNAGSTLYLPALVTISHKLATTGAMVKLSLSCYLLTFGCSQILYGPLSDAYGRRKILIAGMAIFVVGSILASLSTNITFFLISRLIEGLGIGAANAIGYALIRDIYSGNELIRKLSFVSIFVGLTPVIAPLCGGYIVEYSSWQGCFIALSVLSGFLVILQFTKLPETNISLNPDAIKLQHLIKNFTTLLLNRDFLAFILASGIGFSIILSLNSLLPFIMIKHLHVAPSKYGWLTLCTGAGYLSGSYIGGILATKIGPKKTIYWGTILSMLFASFGFILAFFAYNIPIVMIPLMLITFGVGFIIPIAAGGAMSLFPQLAGSAAALLGSIMFIVSAIFTSIVAHLSTNTQRPLFLFIILLGVLAFLFINFIRPKDSVK